MSNAYELAKEAYAAIGVDTEKCMLSGSVLGTAVLLDGITQRIEEELGDSAVYPGMAAFHVKRD